MKPEVLARLVRDRYFDAYPFRSPAQEEFLEGLVLELLKHEPAPAADVWGRFVCVGDPPFVDLPREWVEELAASFPAVDVPHELTKARLWLEASPQNRKTARGLRRFLLRWIGTVSDRKSARPPKEGGGNSAVAKARRMFGGGQ